MGFLFVLAWPLLCTGQLQHSVEQALPGSAGTIVVVDIASGKILAAKNLHLAAQELVRPGSTLKPFVLSVLLQKKRVDSKEKLVCRRPLWIGSLRIDCSHSNLVTQLNAEDAIAYSCNSYVAEVSLRLQPQELVEALRQAGLDSPTGLTKNEAIGRIERTHTQEEIQLMALGLRGIEVTPLELLMAYRNLALRRNEKGDGPPGEIFQGLEHAVAYGTAHASNVDGWKVAGKTGTATSAPGSHTNGLFVGYAPADNPEIAIVVYLVHSRGLDAAAVAQPVFSEYWQLKKKP
jgi:cell division protein FtsI/penicillin-binding protein 2